MIIASGPNVWTIAALEVVAGACVTASFSLWETSIQEHIPGDALSRVSRWAGGVGIVSALGVAAIPSVRRLPRGPSGDAEPVATRVN